MLYLENTQKAIIGENLDGWLFCNFSHRDTLTDALLGLDPLEISSRRWFYIIPAQGHPVKIVHVIEKDILTSLPGHTIEYSSRDTLISCLDRYSGLRIAVLTDPDIQVLSTLDAASFCLIRGCGIQTTSAASLVQRVKGLLDSKGIVSHQRAANILYTLVHDSWRLVKSAFRESKPLFEGDIQDYMLARFAETGLVTDHPPIVASGPNSGNPHYSIPKTSSGTDSSFQGKPGRGRRFLNGDVIQFDLWAKEKDGIYADISWVGFCGSEIPGEISRRFNAVTQARDLVKPAIEAAFAQKKRITGAELDRLVRAHLLKRFPENAVRHRTGHGIDTDCHGSGVNLDSTEFPDDRFILEGSCFSVEPGLYFPDSGFRTEIDIYIHDEKPVISGGDTQKSVLLL